MALENHNITTEDLATIKRFLALPAEALPGAMWYDDCDALRGSALAYLRDAVLPEERQEMNHIPARIRLHADRDSWREGVIVTC